MKTTLLIMAAGIGSRFGGGIKQLETVGPGGEIIMDYSVHDAIRAGFGKIVFIIRRDIEKEFREVIGDRISSAAQKAGVETAYCFQDMEDVPAGTSVPAGRTRPLGTGQAVLAARHEVDGPFAVINADDYYGRDAFEKVNGFLQSSREEEPDRLCMAGFILKNTLSENGAVTRGICEVDADGYLTAVHETRNIRIVDGRPEADGVVLDPDAHVSMNMWGLTLPFMQRLEDGFRDFLNGLGQEGTDPLKDEYLLPVYIGTLLQEKSVSVKVLETREKWFGMTYKEDVPAVRQSFTELVEQGIYKKSLYIDL